VPDDVAERVVKVVSKVLKVPQTEVTSESRFIEDLGANSMRSVELIAAFDEEFDLDMDIDEAGKVRSVGHAVEFIRKELAK